MFEDGETPDNHEIEAWHFVGDDGRNARTGRAAQPGATERVAGEIVPEKWGLHACESAADAVFWARGLTVCRVRLGGRIVRGRQKLAAAERIVLWTADATETVWSWLCWCADRAVECELRAGRQVEAEFVAAVEARRLWLRNRAAGQREIERLRGICRQSLRRVCGMNARGKPTKNAGASGARRAMANLTANLVILANGAHRPAAARPRGWRETDEGMQEAATLDAMLWRLKLEGVYE